MSKIPRRHIRRGPWKGICGASATTFCESPELTNCGACWLAWKRKNAPKPLAGADAVPMAPQVAPIAT